MGEPALTVRPQQPQQAGISPQLSDAVGLIGALSPYIVRHVGGHLGSADLGKTRRPEQHIGIDIACHQNPGLGFFALPDAAPLHNGADHLLGGKGQGVVAQLAQKAFKGHPGHLGHIRTGAGEGRGAGIGVRGVLHGDDRQILRNPHTVPRGGVHGPGKIRVLTDNAVQPQIAHGPEVVHKAVIEKGDKILADGLVSGGQGGAEAGENGIMQGMGAVRAKHQTDPAAIAVQQNLSAAPGDFPGIPVKLRKGAGLRQMIQRHNGHTLIVHLLEPGELVFAAGKDNHAVGSVPGKVIQRGNIGIGTAAGQRQHQTVAVLLGQLLHLGGETHIKGGVQGGNQQPDAPGLEENPLPDFRVGNIVVFLDHPQNPLPGFLTDVVVFVVDDARNGGRGYIGGSGNVFDGHVNPPDWFFAGGK